MPTVFGESTFVSPAVFVSEIDQTVLPAQIDQIGGAIVGLSGKGPTIPTKVGTFDEYVRLFGNLDPDYDAPYAVYSHLLNAPGVTFQRVLGHEDDQTTLKAGGLYEPGLKHLVMSSSGENPVSIARLMVSGSGMVIRQDGATDGTFVVEGTAPDGAITPISASVAPGAADSYRLLLNYDPSKLTELGHVVIADYGDWFEPDAGVSVTIAASGSAATMPSDWQTNHTSGSTTKIKSQVFGAGVEYNLFEFHTLGQGRAASRDVKVSIQNIRPSTNTSETRYGTFDVVVRRFADTDTSPIELERFNNLNLDPASANYIYKRVGDMRIEFNTSTRKFDFVGEYDNQSQFIRVVDALTAGTPEEALPWGFRGYLHASGGVGGNDSALEMVEFPVPYTRAMFDHAERFQRKTHWGVSIGNQQTGSWDASLVVANQVWKTGSFNPVFQAEGVARRMEYLPAVGAIDEEDIEFSLSNLSCSAGNGPLTPARLRVTSYLPDGWAAATRYSYPTVNAELSGSSTGTQGFQIPPKLANFTVTFAGGWDGWDITKADPFEDLKADSLSADSLETIALKKAVDHLANPDEVDINLLAVPGVALELVTDHVRDIVRDRGDVFYVMDVSGSSVDDIITIMDNRNIDDNFTAVYYPNLVMQDPVNRRRVPVPASVGVMGAIAFNDKVKQPWFAPAGMNRGGLRQFGIARAQERLITDERDRLYRARINPIATISGNGPVVWGQKTLQSAESALDRVNVRRLLLKLRKTIASAAQFLVFEPNDNATRTRLRKIIEPLLRDVQANRGIEDYRVVVDETVNTDDLIDRNILKGVVFIKPTRTAEYIVLPFVVTGAGAEFAIESISASTA